MLTGIIYSLTLINLIENAIKYAAKPSIIVKTFEEGNDYCIANY